jgi:hypothetical protein
MSFNDDQPRDELGRWSSGGGGGAVSGSATTWAETKSEPVSAASMLAASPGSSPLEAAEASLEENKEQLKAVQSYVNGGDVLNGMMREERDNEFTAKDENTVGYLDNAISAQAPTTQDSVLYRGVAPVGSTPGIGVPGPGLTPAPDFASMQAGDQFTDKGFISTTTNPSLGEKFATTQGTQLEIHAPAGTQGLSVPAVTGVDILNEQEVVLPRGSEFTVLEPRDEMTGVMKVSIGGSGG